MFFLLQCVPKYLLGCKQSNSGQIAIDFCYPIMTGVFGHEVEILNSRDVCFDEQYKNNRNSANFVDRA